MSLIQTIEDSGAASLSAIEHGAAWLVGMLATGETALHTLEASSPLVTEAVAVGEAAATAHGVPLSVIADVGGAVLTAAKLFAAGLTQRPPAPVAPAAA